MKRILTTLLVALTLGAGMQLQARNEQVNDEREDKAEMQEKRATRLAQQLKLDEETTDWFVPLYVAYQDSLQAVKAEAQLPDGKKQKDITDEEALALIEATLTQSEQEVAVKRAFLEQFKEKLDGKSLVFVFIMSERQPNQGNNRQGGQGNRGGQGGGMPQGGMPGGMPGGGF